MKIPEWSLPTGTTFFSILVQFPIIPKRHWVSKCIVGAETKEGGAVNDHLLREQPF